MQENLTIARPYAQAVFEQARGSDALAAWSDALDLLAAAVTTQDLKRLIRDPRVGHQRLLDLIFAIGGEGFFPAFRNLVRLLVTNHRLFVVPEIRTLFEEHRAAAENVATVEIRSAYPFEPAEEQAIIAAMSRRLRKKVSLTTLVDRSLIGGAVIRVGDTVIDGSLRGRLQQLANEFNISR